MDTSGNKQAGEEKKTPTGSNPELAYGIYMILHFFLI